jgi:hypothetical protein
MNQSIDSLIHSLDNQQNWDLMHANESKIESSAQFRFDCHWKPGIAQFWVLICEKSADRRENVNSNGKKPFSSDKKERLMS